MLEYALQKDLETDEKKEIHFRYFCSRKIKTDCSLLMKIRNILKTTIAFEITKKNFFFCKKCSTPCFFFSNQSLKNNRGVFYILLQGWSDA